MSTPITESPPAVWDEEELARLKANYNTQYGFGEAASKYNPKPGARRGKRRPVHPRGPRNDSPIMRATRCRHRPHRVPARAPKQLPLLQRGGEVCAGGAGGRRPAVRWGGRRGVAAPVGARPQTAAAPLRAPDLLIKACEKASRALAEWMPMYHPTAEQAEIDRKKAYESGVPHGYVPPGDKYKDLPTITLTVLSELVRQYWQGH